MIFDDKERFEQLVNETNAFGFTCKDYGILIKMYRLQGLTDQEINKKIYDDYVRVNVVSLKKAFENTKGMVYEPPKKIIIYKEELDLIKKELNYEYQKVLFIALCICKIFTKKPPFNRMLYEANRKNKIGRVIKLSGAKLTKEQKDYIGYDLTQEGFIDTDWYNWILLYYRDSGTPAMEFAPYNDMIYEYRSYIGDRVVRCAECGKWIYKRGNKTKYCSSCAKVVKNRQTAEIVKERRMLENRK